MFYLVFTEPKSLTIKNKSASTFNLSWSEPDVGGNALTVMEYIVRWNSHNNSGGGRSVTVPRIFAVLNNLSSNTEYYISVAARGTLGGPDGKLSNKLKAVTCK